MCLEFCWLTFFGADQCQVTILQSNSDAASTSSEAVCNYSADMATSSQLSLSYSASDVDSSRLSVEKLEPSNL